MKRNTRSRLSS